MKAKTGDKIIIITKVAYVDIYSFKPKVGDICIAYEREGCTHMAATPEGLDPATCVKNKNYVTLYEREYEVVEPKTQNMKYEVSKEFILEAYEAASDGRKRKIEREFPGVVIKPFSKLMRSTDWKDLIVFMIEDGIGVRVQVGDTFGTVGLKYGRWNMEGFEDLTI